MSKIQYVIDGNYPADAYDLPDADADEYNSDWELELLAQIAAEDYWDYHDGWEAHWPLDVELFIDGKGIGIYSVEMEASPNFTARKKERAA